MTDEGVAIERVLVIVWCARDVNLERVEASGRVEPSGRASRDEWSIQMQAGVEWCSGDGDDAWDARSERGITAKEEAIGESAREQRNSGRDAMSGWW
jgi:hypothetical protein